MTELIDGLEKLIQQAALDGALTEDAVAQFHSLVLERNSLKEANDEWNESDRKQKKEIETLSTQYTEMHSRVGGFNARVADLEEREAKCTGLEIRKECAELRVKDHVKMVELIFRNSVLRKEVMTPSESHTDVNGAQHNSYSSKDTVEEEEG